jgi:hypothetical protein
VRWSSSAFDDYLAGTRAATLISVPQPLTVVLVVSTLIVGSPRAA